MLSNQSAKLMRPATADCTKPARTATTGSRSQLFTSLPDALRPALQAPANHDGGELLVDTARDIENQSDQSSVRRNSLILQQRAAPLLSQWFIPSTA
jgi:hypothetical protein